jgi:hypothetical protein
LAAPISHAKSPYEIAADKAFDEEKDTFDEGARTRRRVRRQGDGASDDGTRASATVTAIAKATSISSMGLDRLTDIELEAGESLTAEPVAGDTEGWIKSEFTSGSGGSARTHIVVKPRDEGIEIDRQRIALGGDGIPPFTPVKGRVAAARQADVGAEAVPGRAEEGGGDAGRREQERLRGLPDKLNFRYRVKGATCRNRLRCSTMAQRYT